MLADRWAMVGEKARWKLVAGLVPQRVDVPRAEVGPSEGQDCRNAQSWMAYIHHVRETSRRRSDEESGAQGRDRAGEKFEHRQHEAMRLEELPEAESMGGEEGRYRA